jgi:NRAMP (natural resistance-associated macrophage protein)-like metal ion transporter
MKRLLSSLKRLGPGLVTGAADDDPSGIATYSQAGAKYGLGLIWTSLLTLPLLVSVQEIASRIGLVTGKGLVSNLKGNYHRSISVIAVLLLLIANTINLGADLGAIAAAIQLIIPISEVRIILFSSLLILVLEIFIPYKKYASVLKFLALSLIAYVVTGLIVITDWQEVLVATVIPQKISLDFHYVFLLVGVLGTTISPYMMFWQSNQEVEEEHDMHISPHNGDSERIPGLLKRMRLDTWLGMTFSNLAAWFIIAVTAITLHANGIVTIETAAQAAKALEPLAGAEAKYLFALGIIGTGLLAVPIFAGGSAYALSELFGWKEGLNKKFARAPAFYLVIVISTLLGVVMNLLHVDPIKALIYAAVINGCISVPLIGLLLHMGNNEDIVGKYKSPLWVNIAGAVTFVVMAVGLVALLVGGQ